LDTTLADIVENDLGEDSSLWWSDEKAAKLFNQMSDSHRNVLLELSRRSSYSYATVFKRMRRGKSMAEVRSDGIAGCLRTPRRGSSRQILISFKLPTNANKGYFAMGDAVCVPVIEYLSEHVLLPLYNRIVASNQSCTSRSLLPT
jgi:DNA (cytosine-5)-methyltransferase 1